MDKQQARKLYELADRLSKLDVNTLSEQQLAERTAMIAQLQEVKQRLDPKCWDGYKKQGTKMKGGVRVNNCVPESADHSVAEAMSDRRWFNNYNSWKSAASKLATDDDGENYVKLDGKLIASWRGKDGWIDRSEQGVAEGAGANKTHLAMAYLKAVVMAPMGTPEKRRILNWQQILSNQFDIEMDTATLAQMLPQFDSMLQAGKLDKLQNRMARRGELEIGESQQGVAEGGYPEVDHMPGPTIKRTQTGCKRCHGKGYVYKTPDGEVHPTNQVNAKKYKCGKCNGIGFVKVAEQGVAEGEQRMSRAAKGHEKYGKAGMAALAKAGREGAGEEKLDQIRDKHNKYSDPVEEGYTVTPGIDRERYQARDGLEGPFSTKSGKVVYYDKVEGKYYDPDTDMYIEYADWLAMNESDGEYNDEAGMAESNLHTMARAVAGLIKTIEADDNLPEWAQEKIAKAEMMVTSVWDYLLSQKEQGVDPKVQESKKPSPKLTPVNIKKTDAVSEEINTEAYERLQKVFAFKNYES